MPGLTDDHPHDIRLARTLERLPLPSESGLSRLLSPELPRAAGLWRVTGVPCLLRPDIQPRNWTMGPTMRMGSCAHAVVGTQAGGARIPSGAQ